METQATEPRLAEEDLAAMARIAGLRISADRLPRLRQEMLAALRADRDMESAVQKATVPGSEPFDAAWQAEPKRRGA